MSASSKEPKQTEQSRCLFTPEQKAQTLHRHLVDKVPVSQLCAELKLQPSVLDYWQTQRFERAAVALSVPKPAASREPKTHRWFPPKRSSPAPTFRLHPFEFPRLPLAGRYTIVYFDAAHPPLGGPLHNVVVDTDAIDPALNDSDGDRGWRLNPP